jgi:hypothetical protein
MLKETKSQVNNLIFSLTAFYILAVEISESTEGQTQHYLLQY